MLLTNSFSFENFSNQGLDQLKDKKLALVSQKGQKKIIVIPRCFSIFFNTNILAIYQASLDNTIINSKSSGLVINKLCEKKIKKLANQSLLVLDQIINLIPHYQKDIHLSTQRYQRVQACKHRLKKFLISFWEEFKFLCSSEGKSLDELRTYSNKYRWLNFKINKINSSQFQPITDYFQQANEKIKRIKEFPELIPLML
jgi:hypothetical protein